MSRYISLFLVCIFGAALVTSARVGRQDTCKNYRTRLDSLGMRIFMIGDRGLTFPKTEGQVRDVQCKRVSEAIEKARAIIGTCLKPFPKQVIGVLLRGMRVQSKKICSTVEGRVAAVEQLSCIEPMIEEVHQGMDRFIDIVETVRDTVQESDLKVPYVCCYVYDMRNRILDKIISRNICTQDSVTYVKNLIDGAFHDALDLACGPHVMGSSKCKSLIDSNPIVIPRGKTSRSKSPVIAIVDILTNI